MPTLGSPNLKQLPLICLFGFFLTDGLSEKLVCMGDLRVRLDTDSLARGVFQGTKRSVSDSSLGTGLRRHRSPPLRRLADSSFHCDCGPSLFQAAVELGGGGGNRASSNATALSAFTELQPSSLMKCTRDRSRTLANFQSPEIVGSDHFCQGSRCFRRRGFADTLTYRFHCRRSK